MKLTLFYLFSTLVLADFAVISDIHYDRYYATGSPSKCLLGKTGLDCCRPWSIGTNESVPASEYGTIGCDSPKALLQLVFTFLSKLPVDHLVFLGDAVDHDLFLQNPSYNREEIETVANFFKTLPFPTWSLLGNHDGFIVDNLWDDEYGENWLKNISEMYNWPDGRGYYTIQNKNYTAIFLNCLGYDKHNLELVINPEKDLFNQSAWFKEQISKITGKIFLFSHFGSDTGEAIDFYNSMISTLNRSDITYFAGHSHSDEIRMGNSSFFYIHPSIVPDGHFPEIRVYREENGEIIDYYQYGFNLTSLQFQFIYNAKDSYDLPDLFFKSWDNFFARMNSNLTLRDLYNFHSSWGA